MFVILDNGTIINTRHVAAVFPMGPSGYPAGANLRYVLRMANMPQPQSDVVISDADYREILGALTL